MAISITSVENNIRLLRENGYLTRIDSNKAGKWKVLKKE